MNTYHVIGILERDNQRKAIDQHLPAANVMAAMNSLEVDGWHWLGKVTVIRQPCQDDAAYGRQVALARNEVAAIMSAPKQMRLL
jgi:hypothetical protein